MIKSSAALRFTPAIMFGLTMAATSTNALAQYTGDITKEFVPFSDFMQRTKAAVMPEATRSGARVKDAASFEEMRRHILSMYRGVEVNHSFMMHANHFDCVPVMQQPTVQAFGITSIADAPPQSMIKQAPAPAAETAIRSNGISQVSADQTDRFGNSMACEAGTIPMRRLTLDEMTHYPTLREFFQKGPDGVGRPTVATPAAASPAATATVAHKYSFTSQTVDNLGGSSTLNLWSPAVNTALGENFSLSQEWYVGGSGSGLQTAEVGWQNFPNLYGSQDSRLFIYWTADNYTKTGCYNLDCPAFVQVANNGVLGAGWSTYSTYQGDQWEFTAQYLLYEGNWWLAVQGTWIGYFPGTLYNGGQLTKNAQKIEFGSESTGTTVWPGEGSGYWSNSGYGSAAYQRSVTYTDLQGNTNNATLTPVQPSLGCYSITGPFTDNNGNTYFYEGGPGGSGC